MSDRKKTAQYRRCVFTDGQGNTVSGGNTLQDLLQAAKKSVPEPWQRAISTNAGAYQLLTDLLNKNACLCGKVVFYEKGRKVPLVDVETNGKVWQGTVQPTANGKVRQFEEQALFFAIRENHVALLQSISLQAEQLLDFFIWLLESKAQLISKTLIDFDNLPARSALEKLKDHTIKGIKISDQLFTKVKEEVSSPVGETTSKRKRYIQRIETSSRVAHILKEFGVGQPIIDKISQNSDPGSVKMDLEISYRSRSEKEGTKVLHALANTLGKQDGLDTEIRLDGKTTIKGDEMSIRGDIMVQCPDGCISVDDALSKLSRWLADEIKNGHIP